MKLTVRPAGPFQESVQSARGGAVSLTGTWKVSGENAILDGTYSEGPPRMQGTKRTLTVKKSDDHTLEGMRWSVHEGEVTEETFLCCRLCLYYKILDTPKRSAGKSGAGAWGSIWPDDGWVNSLDESEWIIVKVTPTRVFSWGHRLVARLAPGRPGASPCTRGRATSRPAPALGSRRGVVPSRTGRPSTSRCRSRHRSRREPRRH